MPKAPATFSQDDEEEKTTIESGWEEEASTTVEQGDVADKLRAINGAANGPRVNTNITSTNGGALEEPTVDDQRAHAALSLLTPSVAPARIVVTGGNDKGQELEIRPGKTYTIGRAIDNDLVLTDIAVSRKHFDLRHENGTWIVVDRGSGNGTVINGNIEDQPFVLMNGDSIEIGNTAFRFDHANQPARRPRGFDDEEEPSTVAGKPPMRSEELPAAMMPPPRRPKTVPPPAPLPRPRPPSSAPPVGYMNGANGARGSIPPVPSAAPIGQPTGMPMGGPIGVPMASPTAPTVSPMQQMPAMRPPPMQGMPMQQPMQPMQPTMLDQNGMLRPQMLHNAHEGMQMPGVMPTTIPGQGPPVAPSQPQVLPFSYPHVGDMKPQLGQLQINGNIPRDATSTALVQPAPYGVAPAMTPAVFGVAQPQPGISKKVKALLAGALLMVLAAIATILIIKSADGDKKKPAPKAKTAPTVEPIKDSGARTTDTGRQIVAETKDPKKAEEQKRLDDQKKVEAKKLADDQKKLEEQKKAEEQKRLDDQKKLEEQKKAEEQKRLDDQKKAEAKKLADEQRRIDEQKRLDARKSAEAQKRLDAERRAEELRQRKEEQRRADEARKKKAAERAAEAKKNRTQVAVRETDTTVSTTKKPPADTSEVKNRAEELYRAKKFNDAARTLRTAAERLGEADARELRSTAAVYEQVGKAYNVGMGPATPPVEAFTSLERALNLDRPMGVFSDEIRSKLAMVAPKAATKFMADRNYEAAFKAVRVAEQYGGGNSTTQAIRGALVDAANELYTSAMAEKGSNPVGARAKLQRIKGMVDKGSILAKAEKAIRELPAK